jgi:hypothetical protein
MGWWFLIRVDCPGVWCCRDVERVHSLLDVEGIDVNCPVRVGCALVQ